MKNSTNVKDQHHNRRAKRLLVRNVLWFLALTLCFSNVALPAIPAAERDTLIAIYQSAGGDHWVNNSNWKTTTGDLNSSGTECTWYGIVCSADESTVISLQLGFPLNGLSGTLPSLQGLTNLQAIYMSSSSLSGPLPSFSGLTQLQSVFLSENNFTGPIPSLTGLVHLQVFSVGSNHLTGSLPAFDNLPNLQTFLVSQNQLSGPIPALSALTALTDFEVDQNALTGSIPDVSTLSNLTTLSVSSNHLTGSIPSIASASFQILNADGNALSGPIPSLNGLANLMSLHVSNNQLSGSIPNLDGLRYLTEFTADNNQLTGALPALNQNSSLQRLSVNNNQLTGGLPSALPVNTFFSLSANHNQLSGHIDTIDAYLSLDVSYNNLTGDLPDFHNLIAAQINVDHNQLTGSLPTLNNQLIGGTSSVCPNRFNPNPDSAWDRATGVAPWYTNCQTTSPIHIVAASGNVTGGIAPAGAIQVVDGNDTFFNITSALGQRTTVGGTCGGTLAGNVFTTNPITADCTVVATQSGSIYTVTALPSPNGTVSPATQHITSGDWALFTITPDPGYVARVSSDHCGAPRTTDGGPGSLVARPSIVEFYIQSDCAVSVLFSAGYIPVVPARLLDTRPGYTTIDGQFNGAGALQSGSELDLPVVDRGGVVAHDVTAVALNVTAINPTLPGFLTVWTSGLNRPHTSNLNFNPNHTTPNMVIAAVGTDGKISLFTSAGPVDVVVDVVGYFGNAGVFTPVPPARALDTRLGATTDDGMDQAAGPLAPGSTLDLSLANRFGLFTDIYPRSILMNVTGTDASANAFITLWPSDQARPATSSLNVTPGVTVPALVISGLSDQRTVSLFNSAGNTDLIADVMGTFSEEIPFGGLTPVSPGRILDTRPGMPTIDGQFSGGGPIGPSQKIDLAISGRVLSSTPFAHVNAVVDSVVLNVTVTNPTAPGFLTEWPSGISQPVSSNLNFLPGQTASNMVIAKVGSNGSISFFNSAGTTDVIVDVVGFFNVPVRN